MEYSEVDILSCMVGQRVACCARQLNVPANSLLTIAEQKKVLAEMNDLRI